MPARPPACGRVLSLSRGYERARRETISVLMTRPVLIGLCAALLVAGAPELCEAAPPVSVPHLVKGPYLTGLGEDRVDVRFELDAPSAMAVAVVAEGPGGRARTLASAAATMHVVHVAGLDAATAYTYEVRAGAAVAAKGRFVTAPRPDAGAPLTFLLYGDDRSDETAHEALVAALRATPSDFLVNTGDIVADGGHAEDWESFFRVEAPLLHDRALFLCIGNHELYDDAAGANFARYFGFTDAAAAAGRDAGGPPLPYGTMRWGAARFFFLNGMHDWSGGDERQWLERELAHADAEPGLVWRIAVVHHSPWSSGPHGGNARLLEAGVPELLAAHHVDLLLAGHDHIYERGQAGPIKYLVSGGGGAPLYPVNHPIVQSRRSESSFHFVEVRAAADAMRIVTHRVDGSTVDRCGFAHGAPWDCDAAPIAPSSPQVGNPPAPSKANSAASCGCTVPGGGASDRFPLSETAVAWSTLGPLAAVWARVRRRRRG
jgi:predicted MPP superfamily phosphohydrolase